MVTGLRPGRGDDAMVSAVQEILPTLGIPPEKTVVISGARAPAIATGIRVNRADLSVWVVMSEEDALAFGGSHVIHALRRNVSLKIVLLSDGAFDAVPLALATGASFVARAMEGDREHLTEMLAAAAAHNGAALVEVRHVSGDASLATPLPADRAVRLVPGRPILFGDQAVVRDPATGELLPGSPADANVVVHDDAAGNPASAFELSRLPETGVRRIPVGVFRSVPRETFDELFRQQSGAARQGDLQQLLVSDDYHQEDRDDLRNHRALH